MRKASAADAAIGGAPCGVSAAAPCVIVHGAPDVIAACDAAQRLGRALTLLSAPGAAGTLGSLWWSSLIGWARDAYPALPIGELLDCGDAPGRVQEALHCGLRRLILAPCPAFAPLSELATRLGGVLLAAAPPSLDLALPSAGRRLAAWLAPPSSDDHPGR